MDIKVKVGKKIRQLRKRAGLSQEKLALEADIDRTYIQSIEKGERSVSIVILEKIAIALKIDIKELFE